jgi:predicted anti-sigma-YlaC factor YlaD
VSGSLLNSLQRLSPTCRQAARLISDAMERDLPAVDRVGMSLHLAICRACRRYRRSVAFLSQLLRIQSTSEPPLVRTRLPEGARSRILQRIREHIGR